MMSTFLINYIRDRPILLDPDVNVYYAMVLTWHVMLVLWNKQFLNFLNLWISEFTLVTNIYWSWVVFKVDNFYEKSLCRALYQSMSIVTLYCL